MALSRFFARLDACGLDRRCKPSVEPPVAMRSAAGQEGD